MCGLAGVARTDGCPLDESADTILAAMIDALTHRGPDDARTHREAGVGLAFTRLSIVDPVGGDQPLTTEDGSVVLIANGEIYNHRELERGLPPGTRLRTRSDCEVLVHLWRRDGIRFLDQVRGICAVVLWDRTRNRLVFARDRFGIKPLYYHRGRNRITFASEIKALFADPACPRELDWARCLTDQMITSEPRLESGPPASWFAGVQMVPAATVVEIDLSTGATSEHRYWELPRAGDDPLDQSAGAFVEEYRSLLRTSVRESGMSDAEVGLFLSGGVDSAAIAAFSDELPALHTFTALNGGTLANGDAEYAHVTAAALGRPNHQILFDLARIPAPQQWRDLVWLLESPLCGPEQYFKYEMHRYARAIRPELKVMLLGQASDEFNGGYSVELGGGGGWPGFVANLHAMAERQASLDGPHLGPWWENGPPLVRREAREVLEGTAATDPYARFVAWKYRDIQQYNCWHEDRTAAGNGVEARVPFLDHRIVELTARIPAALRERLLWDKRIVREAMAGILPDEVVRRPKVPFFYGAGVGHVYRTFARMLTQQDGVLIEEACSAPTASRLIDAGGVRQVLDAVLAGRPGAGIEHVLRLVNLGLLERMLADLPGPMAGRPRVALPERIDIGARTDFAQRLAERFADAAAVAPGDVPSYPPGVLLVHADAEDGVAYLVIDGALEYVVEEKEAPTWLAFLRSVDGVRTVAEITGAVGGRWDVLLPLLTEARQAGVLHLAGAAVPAPATDTGEAR